MTQYPFFGYIQGQSGQSEVNKYFFESKTINVCLLYTSKLIIINSYNNNDKSDSNYNNNNFIGLLNSK